MARNPEVSASAWPGFLPASWFGSSSFPQLGVTTGLVGEAAPPRNVGNRWQPQSPLGSSFLCCLYDTSWLRFQKEIMSYQIYLCPPTTISRNLLHSDIINCGLVTGLNFSLSLHLNIGHSANWFAWDWWTGILNHSLLPTYELTSCGFTRLCLNAGIFSESLFTTTTPFQGELCTQRDRCFWAFCD